MSVPETAYVGRPISRVDGPKKVSGAAKYAAEYNMPGLLYGVVVSSEIARGTITEIDTAEAEAVPGVVKVLTHANRPSLAWFDRSYRDEIAPTGSPFRPLGGAEIKFSGQPVALVVAETFETARHAAMLVRVKVKAKHHATGLEAHQAEAQEPPKGKVGYSPPQSRGDAEKALTTPAASVSVDERYSLPSQHHNPMEPFATTAVWEGGGKLTVYDKTQGCQNVRDYLCKVFGDSHDDLRVVSPFVGGAFGSGLRPQYQVVLAVMAAKELERSVRVSLTRQQMFTIGYRPGTLQRVALGSAPDGTLGAIIHEAVAETSQFEDYVENVVNWTGMLYRCDNIRLDYRIVPLDLMTPIDMRAPGAATGIFALEVAMDELAVKLGVDPVALRLKNYAEEDQVEGKPFSSKELRACYQLGAERFGWARRDPEPRSMRRGDTLVGWGMATGVWDAMQGAAKARAILNADGKLTVSSATADIGPGTYTIMTQIAAEALGLPLEDVTFLLGDSSMPTSPVQGGSWTASTIGSAVQKVCLAVRERVFALAKKAEGSSLAHASHDEVEFADGRVRLIADPDRGVTIVEALRSGGGKPIEEEAKSQPDLAKQAPFSRYSHSAIFAEVEVDPDFGTVKVTRVVNAVAAGRILNPKTARSQVMGAVVMGIGMALHEESVMDHALGRFMNHSLAEFHVPVNADIGQIDVIFAEERDDVVNPLGVKGIGEIGLVGTAAAVVNAIHHATGRRVRDLPVTLDKLL
ncbi:xanthine dehydrogenase family protein molybdopterin-binding subunit [Isosphaeraceae bacterium EP7]